jgi:hypothetical protein
MRTCKKCGETKPEEEFYRGKGYTCNECRKKYLAEYNRTHPRKRDIEKERERHRNYRQRLKETRGCTYPSDEYAERHRARQRDYDRNRRIKDEAYAERHRAINKKYREKLRLKEVEEAVKVLNSGLIDSVL